MMKYLFLTLISLITIPLFAQDQVTEFTLKKGEVLDVLLLTFHPDTKEEFAEYRKKAFPVAEDYSYQPIKTIKITKNHFGNRQPNALVLAKWDNLASKERFLGIIDDQLPWLHEKRRLIWSIFDLRYYEVLEDVTVRLDPAKYTVVTAIWSTEDADLKDLRRKWKQNIADSEGVIDLLLTGGKSPFGYSYDPDLWMISTWESEEAYLQFRKSKVHDKHPGIKHLSQLAL